MIVAKAVPENTTGEILRARTEDEEPSVLTVHVQADGSWTCEWGVGDNVLSASGSGPASFAVACSECRITADGPARASAAWGFGGADALVPDSPRGGSAGGRCVGPDSP